ncbi:PLP-dependent transferase [Clavulina sp. PMI_390]|nr:PLP-dependent transferase [Clavulina sp. PMI_390]
MTSAYENPAFDGLIDQLTKRLDTLHTAPVIAAPDAIDKAFAEIPNNLPEKGVGTSQALEFVERIVVPALATGHAGPRYFGFVIGGSVPAATYGDVLTTIYDQNVQVHLPRDTVSTVVEARVLEMLLDLFNLEREDFTGRTVTTGATASNVLGLACGRDFAVRSALNDPNYSVAEDGFGGVTVKVLGDRIHSSTMKAAAIVGIGRSNVIDVHDPVTKGFDLKKLEELLASSTPENKTGFIVCPSFGEVNTGEFTSQMHEVRVLCNKYHAWIHIDAAFGGFARVVPELAHLAEGLELADSITGDGHKWLNVPYDSGFFFCRSRKLQASVFGPSPRSGAPAYLSTTLSNLPASIADIPSPLNMGIENSRRFRALPMFCALMALGKDGYEEMVRRHIEFARKVGVWMMTPKSAGGGAEWYEVLNASYDQRDETSAMAATAVAVGDSNITNVVPLNVILFRPRSGSPLYHPTQGSMSLIQAVNQTRKMYITPGVGGAARLAVSNWMTGLRTNEEGKSDFDIVTDTLREVMQPSRE